MVRVQSVRYGMDTESCRVKEKIAVFLDWLFSERDQWRHA